MNEIKSAEILSAVLIKILLRGRIGGTVTLHLPNFYRNSPLIPFKSTNTHRPLDINTLTKVARTDIIVKIIQKLIQWQFSRYIYITLIHHILLPTEFIISLLDKSFLGCG